MQLSEQCVGDFGTGEAALKVEGFMLATSKFLHATADVQDQLMGTCKDMGSALGMPAAKLSGDVRTVCNNVAGELSSTMRDVRAEANLQVEVVSTPPKCEVNVDAYAECAAECDARYEPGKVDIQCEGGYIAGQCDARCTGECNVDVRGKCGGACEGSCEGSCEGKCEGHCDGQCSQRGPDGQCNGRCQGTCHGSCSAGCQGSCDGECWVKGEANCQGSCRGGCSVDYKEPYCTGDVKPPQVEASCKASCDARFNADAQCEPGHTEVYVSGDASSNVEDKVAKARAAIKAGYGGLLATREKLRRLRESGQLMVDAGGQLRGTARGLGAGAVRAGACVTEALAALPRAVASLGVSVQVSVEVSGSVSAGAG
ncbi:MAG: hypothetical protein ACODAU_12840 [Myxococcota bacterium]